jgi:hypothetical protein
VHSVLRSRLYIYIFWIFLLYYLDQKCNEVSVHSVLWSCLYTYLFCIFCILSGSEMHRGGRAQCCTIASIYIFCMFLYILYIFWIRNAMRWEHAQISTHILDILVYFGHFLEMQCSPTQFLSSFWQNSLSW